MIDALPVAETPFDEAARQIVLDLEAALREMEVLSAELPETAFTDEEWAVIETVARDVEEAAERAEEGYVAVQYDSHAWHRIMESQERILQRIRSALGVMQRVHERQRAAESDSRLPQ
ncbi:MAG: hypothetical protein HY320_03120 [Armatimonadetes bacterium]|nr:hypothetical protein [Armatimonadota bacterium]